MMRRLLIIPFLLLSALVQTFAADVEFRTSAPQIVAMGERFKIVFKVTNAKPNDMQWPEMDDFDVLMGPSTSSGISTTIVNGNVTTTETYAYTYILAPKQEGTYTISPARFTLNGKTMMSNSVTIKVTPADSPQNSATQGQNQGQRKNANASSGDKIFARVEYSKKQVYEQEQLIATVKVFHKGNLMAINDLKLPEFNGFIAQEIQITNEKRASDERIDGENYKTYILKQCVLFPQQSGTLTTEKGRIDAVVQVIGERQRSFFGDYYNRYNVDKTIGIPESKIEVLPLPKQGRPENFSNAVGSFKMESTINTEELSANDAINIKVKITGNGNLKYAKDPAFTFPNDFEVYEPKVNSKISYTSSGASGSKEIDNIAIPHYAGEYDIPSAQFSYFDPKAKKYVVLETPKYHLKVAKDNMQGDNSAPVVSNYSNKENIKYLGKDIRYINTHDQSLKDKDDFLFGTTRFWMWYIIPLLLFILLFIAYRKQLEENANVALMRNKKANKKAKKRLKQAFAYKEADDKNAFYGEVLKAMCGYAGDKLNIPVAELSKESIGEELQRRGVEETTITELMNLLEECEMAKYVSPTEGYGSMDQIYDKAADLIGQLEDQVKKA